MKRIILFTAIASVLATGAYAITSTVTSQDYVDTAVATKQNKVTAGTMGSVVTYNGTQNGQTQFGERGIFNPETGFDGETGGVAEGHEGDLVTAGLIIPAMNEIFNETVPAVDMRCIEYRPNTDDCLLWQMRASKAIDGGGNCLLDGRGCVVNKDCCSGMCNTNTHVCYTSSF